MEWDPLAKDLAMNSQTPQRGWKACAEIRLTWVPALTGATWQPGTARGKLRLPRCCISPAAHASTKWQTTYDHQQRNCELHAHGVHVPKHTPGPGTKTELNIKCDLFCWYLLTDLHIHAVLSTITSTKHIPSE